MILLYTLGWLVLRFGSLITQRRARSLERKYVAAAQQADQLAKQLSYRNGNSNHNDLFTNARRQYELGRLVQIRDRLEAKFDTWSAFAEMFRSWRTRLLNWKGRLVPYSLGALDLAVIVGIVLVAGGIDANHLRQSIDSVRAVVRK